MTAAPRTGWAAITLMMQAMSPGTGGNAKWLADFKKEITVTGQQDSSQVKSHLCIRRIKNPAYTLFVYL